MSMYYRANGLSSDCTRCSLSNCPIVHGQSEVPLSEVKLCVISAYPGKEELRQGITLAPAPKGLNAGSYCRLAISSVFNTDEGIPVSLKPFTMYTFFTNAIRCSPSIGKLKRDVKYSNITACKHWLDIEISQLPAGVPILIASGEALKGLLGESLSIYNSRTGSYTYKGHPVVVTMNPVEALRYHPLEITEIQKRRSGLEVPKASRLITPIEGSIPFLFKKDLLMLKALVKEYLSNESV